MTGAFAALWLSERTLTPQRLLGLVVALAGLWAIFGQPWPGDGQARLGTVAVVAGMAIQALGLVWIKRLNVRASSLAITTGSLSVATPLFVLAWLLADGARLPEIAPRAGAAIVYLGVFGSVVGFTLYYYVIKNDGSYGIKGFSVSVLPELFAEEQVDEACICGPGIMMKTAAQMAADAGIYCEVSMERRMGCGTGTCLACVCDKADGGHYKVCLDGPVFNAQEVCL